MEYVFELKMGIEKPLDPNYVKMMVEQSLKDVNVSPFIGEKETATAVNVRLLKTYKSKDV